MNYQFADRMGNLQASAIREILKFTADPEVISFAAGNPAPEAFPVKAVQEITQDIFEKNPITALQYSISEGYTPLRNTLKDYLKTKNSFNEQTDELIIMSGAQQGMELSTKVLCNEGDTIICENPSFIGSLNSFKSFGAHLVGVEVEDDGISIEKLEQALIDNKNTKFIYVIPNFQNPSGVTMSLEKRKAVYELAVKYGVMILEDNPYGELRFAGEFLPNIKSFDTTGNVIYVGSFSKVLSPGLRVGYISAPKEVVSKIVVVKQVSDVHTNILAQMICDKFMNEYDFDSHLTMLREIYRKKCSLMLGCIEEKFSKSIAFTKPSGGLFIWCTLPQGVDMMDFCTKAIQNKVAVVPGSAFMPSDEYKTQSFRLNFSTPADEQIVKGIDILGQLTSQF